jgi:hypothetical protein
MNRATLIFGFVMGCCLALIAAISAQSPNAAELPSGEQTGQRPIVEKPLPTGGSNSSDNSKDPAGEFCKCIGESNSKVVQRIEQALSGPLHSGLAFTDQPLQDVLRGLSEEYRIQILLDRPSLDDAGITTDAPVNAELQGISFKSALRHMLRSLQLNYVIRDEALVITTNDKAESELITCVYDVHDLLTDRELTPPSGGASAWADYDPLIGAITDCIATDTWSENGGGQAQIRPLGAGLLVISQSRDVHEKIREFFAATRQMQVASPPAKAAAALTPPADPDKVITRSYFLQLDTSDKRDEMRSQVQKLITDSLPEETWAGQLPDGQAVTLMVFNDRVVVRQTPPVQEKVQAILKESGVAAPSETAVETKAGSGGFGGGERKPAGGGGGFFRIR